MAIYNKRIAYNKEKLINHYLKRDTLPDFIYGLIRFFGIIIQNIYCVSSYLVLSWIILFPISWLRSDLYSRAENYLYNSLLFIVSSWSMAAGATVVETGDDYKQLIESPDNDLPSQTPAALNHTTKCRANSNANSKVLLSQDKQSKCEFKTDTIKSSFNTDSIGSKVNKNTGDCHKPENDLKLISDDISELICNQSSNNNNTDNNNMAKTLNIGNGNDSKTINQVISNQGLPSSLVYNNKKPRILLLCNHISTADVPLMMQSFSTLTNQSLLWVLDAQFKPTNFGLVCSSHGDFFIAKDSFKDGSLRDQVLKHPDRNLLILFPEGGFLRKRLEGSNRYALKNGLPLTRYVTHPRFGAFKDLIDQSVGVTHIVDATLLYDDIKNPLSILDIVLGTRKEPVILNYRVYQRSEINPTEEWLRNIWLEKDKLMQQYYEDRGCIYKKFEGTMRSAKLDWFKVLSVHLFYLLVCYLTIYRLFSATSVTMLKARDLYYSNI